MRFYGAPVEDRVLPYSRGPQLLGADGVILLPPPHDAGCAALVHWRGRAAASIEDHLGEHHPLEPGGEVVLSQGDLQIRFELVPQYRLPRPPLLGEGDIGLAVSVLAMMVLALQLQLLVELIAALRDDGGGGIEPSPELIVRLLEEDYEGADEGYVSEPAPREAHEKSVQSFYMPAGNRGPLDRIGGAAETAPEPVRTENTERAAEPSFQPLAPDRPQQAIAVTGGPEQAPVPGVVDPQNLQAPDRAEDADREDAPVAAERERGWGFYAWYDADDARRDAEEIRREILQARQRLALDPDDPWALQQLGYYQYLAQQYESCRRTYERFIELNPDDAAGYNNLALIYKRLGDYAKEEGYYRLALAMAPEDDHALNNLAVNLAHQGRFPEALRIMERLESLIPGDPYADLHRAKIYAAMGDDGRALDYLERALEGMARLDTLHHIEFRQDIRVDPAFGAIRGTEPFDELMTRYYGDDAEPLIVGSGSG